MKIDRLIAIIIILLDRKTIRGKVLADRFEVSLRTIYRDIDTINLAGIPVVATPGVKGGFGIMDEYKVDKNVFTATELATLLMGLSSISPMLTGKDTAGTFAKIKSLIPAGQADEIELRSNQISIDLQPWIGNGNLPMALVKDALNRQVVLAFRYADRAGKPSVRSIEPYRLILKESHWYIYGFCLARQNFRLFKLSRMTDLEVMNETFTLRDLPPPVAEFRRRMTDRRITVKLLVRQSIKERVLEYCGSERMEACGEDQWTVTNTRTNQGVL
ncbi:YafY family transcriptional regulator|uniref:Predicted DNA-binding transcriptional regulator YafY, contains an HTH and WYL domains n=1 Tax=Dendrosporobacter quercicolus TaxID=146817 RepID=A0A1G9UWG3_9FIRM|nr:YafY family protein [Dendrosporobacter quercicolus]NSL48012.1 YafY family transcriptional regulator [Dendrosporobacter quercicolus DSM 1736]SDM63955.1 Predicted DNA-binding transcriptional regulator YafY, contains an HTH and WYL domains [Dendrosporobacter quercicolus]